MDEKRLRARRIGQTGVTVALASLSFNAGMLFRGAEGGTAIALVGGSAALLLAAAVVLIWKGDG